MDRSETVEVQLKQGQIAAALGVRRSYVSRVQSRFKAAGILAVRRGHLIVKDPVRLRERACDCTEAVREHFERVLGMLYPAPPK